VSAGAPLSVNVVDGKFAGLRRERKLARNCPDSRLAPPPRLASKPPIVIAWQGLASVTAIANAARKRRVWRIGVVLLTWALL
jgi:hypothetical protein